MSSHLGRVCDAQPVHRDSVDEKARAFVRDLLLNPRRLFSWWEEQQAAQRVDIDTLDAQVTTTQKLLDEATRKYHRILDRLIDNMDEDEVAYYTAQKDQLKTLMEEYRVELSRLQGSRWTNNTP